MNDDLRGKLRRSELLFARVNDELAQYRSSEGKSPFVNIDEEELLRSKLQVMLWHGPFQTVENSTS